MTPEISIPCTSSQSLPPGMVSLNEVVGPANAPSLIREERALDLICKGGFLIIDDKGDIVEPIAMLAQRAFSIHESRVKGITVSPGSTASGLAHELVTEFVGRHAANPKLASFGAIISDYHLTNDLVSPTVWKEVEWQLREKNLGALWDATPRILYSGGASESDAAGMFHGFLGKPSMFSDMKKMIVDIMDRLASEKGLGTESKAE